VLRRLAAERRRVVGEWRVLLECRRLEHAKAAPLPDASQVEKVLRELLRQDLLTPIRGVPGVFRVDAPFADVIPVTDQQVVQEANPLAVFSHLTALVHHGLTEQIPKSIQATHYTPPDPHRVPLGTTPEEWVDLPPPPLKRPKRVGPVPVQWFIVKGKWDFGHTINYSEGLPFYLTDLERTLLDAIRSPADTGGITLVLRAWRQAKGTWNVDRLIEYTDRLNLGILRQRVGYLLEALGVTHSRLPAWKGKLLRGSSVKLVAAEPFAPMFSPEWNLSLNVPPAVLAELEEE
jgi:predicted transcriptional regulator of viral defense system